MDTNNAKKINLDKLPDEKLVRDFGNGKKYSSRSLLIGAGVIIFLGILSGYFLSNTNKGKSTSTTPGGKTISTGKSVGSSDTKTFPDSAEGELQSGGLDGEGTHKLVRPEGESQTVYLTSSVLDLNQFVGKKVKVWGQTFSSKKAGWFMDVGRVELL